MIHPALAEKDLLPAEHLLDAGYVDAGVVVSSHSEHQVRIIGPVPLDTHWQARGRRVRGGMFHVGLGSARGHLSAGNLQHQMVRDSRYTRRADHQHSL